MGGGNVSALEEPIMITKQHPTTLADIVGLEKKNIYVAFNYLYNMTKTYLEEQIKAYIHIVWATYYLPIILNEILYEYHISVKQHSPATTSSKPAIFFSL